MPKNDTFSTAAHAIYDWDMVLLFPLGSKVPCNRRTFVNRMMGLRTVTLNGKPEVFVDEAQRFLHTDRCFIDLAGRPNKVLAQIATDMEHAKHESERKGMRGKRLQEMKRVLEEEYTSYTGSDEPCEPARFCELFCASIMRRLQQACGLTCEAKFTVDKDEIMVCVRADNTDLRTEADRQNYKLQLKNHPFEPLRETAVHEVDFLTGFAASNPKAVQSAHQRVRETCDDVESNPELDPGLFRRGWQPYLQYKLNQFGHDDTFQKESGVYFAPFTDPQLGEADMLPLLRHFRDRKGGPTEFRTVDRIRLVTSIIARHLNTESMKHSKLLLDCFALHEEEKLRRLERIWVWKKDLHPLPGGQSLPLIEIRDYFGEKIGLYFAWLEHYTKSLVWPAFGGLIFFICTKAVNDIRARDAMLVLFGCFVSVWGTFMTEGWKRRNATINLWWGTFEFETHEVARPQFAGLLRYSPITDKPEMYHNSLKQLKKKVAMSFAFVFTLVIGAVGMTAFCLYLKSYLAAPENFGKLGPPIASMINAGWIATGNTIYRMIAVKLTNWENHRTDTEWDRYLVTKTFLFRFFNSYAAFFYIAFLKKAYEGQCGTRHAPATCLDELQLSVIIIFGSQVIVGNGIETMSPYFKYKMRLWRERVQHNKSLNLHSEGMSLDYEQPEHEAKLEPYKEWYYSFDDYSEMVLQYGFVVLFVSACPLVPLLALFNNILEVHVDAYKLVCIFRRPWPYAAMNIGQWAVFMDLLSSISVVTNIGIIIRTSDTFTTLSDSSRWLLFIVAEHALLTLKFIVSELIADTPAWVDQLHRRHNWIATKLKGMKGADHDDMLRYARSYACPRRAPAHFTCATHTLCYLLTRVRVSHLSDTNYQRDGRDRRRHVPRKHAPLCLPTRKREAGHQARQGITDQSARPGQRQSCQCHKTGEGRREEAHRLIWGPVSEREEKKGIQEGSRRLGGEAPRARERERERENKR